MASTPHPSAEAAVWFDLLDPTPEECDAVTHVTGVTLPDRAALAEIETSSRLRASGEVLTMSMPTAIREGDWPPRVTPLGFILTPRHLVTMRYTHLPSFNSAAESCRQSGPGVTSLEAFAGIAEQMVDRLADTLEHIAGVMGELSAAIFSDKMINGRSDRGRGGLREQMRTVGQLGDQTSNIRNALLALGRIVNFVGQHTAIWPGEHPTARLASLREDIISLNEYETNQSERVQFLLDALVGKIGIAQNDVFKFLTIVSIMGIPPTLIASIYGMNFKIIPELHWTYGYPYALMLMFLSAVLPLVWFKWRGWF